MHGEGISTPCVRHKGRQSLIKCAKYDFNLFYFPLGSIHVSFVSECGLLKAGLDYGGLSKEFLTDISKAAFSPE